MTDAVDSGDSRTLPTKVRPSEAEVLQLLQQTVQQYEECMRLADLADISETPKAITPRYSWDNPIGLVVKG